MKDASTLMRQVSEQLNELARGNAVVATPISVGDRHLVPLCELSLGFGGGGGTGKGKLPDGSDTDGKGGGAFGGAKATPVALLVVEGDQVRLETLGE